MSRLKQAPTSNKHLERIIEYGPFSIGLFNTPCFLCKSLNKYCFQLFLGVIVALSRKYYHACVKLWRENKEYGCIFEIGLLIH